MKRSYKLYLNDIIESIAKIEKYLRGISEEQFNSDEKLQDAVIRRLEIIGEASRNIPRAIKETNRDIPWTKISNYRDFITHSYFEASLQRIWAVAKNETPELKKLFIKIKLL